MQTHGISVALRGEDIQEEMVFHLLNHHPVEANRMQRAETHLLNVKWCFQMLKITEGNTEKISDNDVRLEQGLKNIYHNITDH